MRAVRYYGQKDIRVEEIDAPVAGEGEVLIAVSYTHLTLPTIYSV